MQTGFAAVKIGIVMFVIPFVFAFYPELLLIEEAFIDPRGGNTVSYLPGYDGTVDVGAVMILLARLMLALLLLASALAGFDRRVLTLSERILRLALAAALMPGNPLIWGAAAVLAVALLIWHRITGKRLEATAP